MQVECGRLYEAFLPRNFRQFETLQRSVEPLFEVLVRYRQSLCWCLRLRLSEFAVIALINGDAVASDIHEEEPTVGEPLVHLVKRMDDEVDRGLQRARNR